MLNATFPLKPFIDRNWPLAAIYLGLKLASRLDGSLGVWTRQAIRNGDPKIVG
jgi:hypothetical protein